jgi:hypothetical protein
MMKYRIHSVSSEHYRVEVILLLSDACHKWHVIALTSQQHACMSCAPDILSTAATCAML